MSQEAAASLDSPPQQTAFSLDAIPPTSGGSLDQQFQQLSQEHGKRSSYLSPLKPSTSAPAANGMMSATWRALGDSPGTARASRRHRSQPFFIGVAGMIHHKSNGSPHACAETWDPVVLTLGLLSSGGSRPISPSSNACSDR